MNEYIKSVLDIYRENDIDFNSVFNWHLLNGIIVCNHHGFAFGYYVNIDDPTANVPMHHSDSLFVTMCCGDMLKCLEPFVDDFSNIIFQREFKKSSRLRVFSMEKFFKKLKK